MNLYYAAVAQTLTTTGEEQDDTSVDHDLPRALQDYLPPPLFSTVGVELACSEISFPLIRSAPDTPCRSCQEHGSVVSNCCCADEIFVRRAALAAMRSTVRGPTGLTSGSMCIHWQAQGDSRLKVQILKKKQIAEANLHFWSYVLYVRRNCPIVGLASLRVLLCSGVYGTVNAREKRADAWYGRGVPFLFLKGGHLRSSVPHVKTVFWGKCKSYPMSNPMA